MDFQDNRRPRKLPTQRRLTPQEIAAAREEALKWREAWRIEMAASAGAQQLALKQASRPATSADHHAAKFATAVARTEFGRFYWSDKLAQEMVKSLRKTHRRKNNGRASSD